MNLYIVETCGFHLRDEDDDMENNNSSEDELITQDMLIGGAK